jgi:hypothetical protein
MENAEWSGYKQKELWGKKKNWRRKEINVIKGSKQRKKDKEK